MVFFAPTMAAAPLIVKNTFLDLPDEESSPMPRSGLRRRARTETALQELAQPEWYAPGLFADNEIRETGHDRLKLCNHQEAECYHSDVDTASSGLAASDGGSFSSSSSSRSSSPAPEERPTVAPEGSPLRPRPRQPLSGGARAVDKGTEPAPPVRAAAATAAEQRDADGEKVDGRTTVMLRNLPNNYTRAMFLAMLDQEGFAGQYDFVYLPMDFNRRAGLGYAFVNLVDAGLVPHFWRTFAGFNRWVIPTAKVCIMGWSDPLQGLEAHIERYRNSPVMHHKVPEEYRPVLFKAGVRVAFPKPTKSIRPPLSRS